MKDPFFKLNLITSKPITCSTRDYLDFISTCAQAGITSVQLREKKLYKKDLLRLGYNLKTILDSFEIPFIVNDNLDLCLKLNASGVHFGQQDGNPIDARKSLGSKKIIGLTVNTLSQIEAANLLPIDYVGVGAIFPTNNKPDVETIWGIDGLKKAVNISIHPIVAVGGINVSNARIIIKAGANGIAAIGAFHDAINPKIKTHHLRKIIDKEVSWS